MDNPETINVDNIYTFEFDYYDLGPAAVFVLILFTYLPESQIQKKKIIQTNSFIIFTCPNQVLLVPASGKWVRTKTAKI